MTLLEVFNSSEKLDGASLIVLGGIIAILGVTLSTFVQWYRLSHIPGPTLASLTSLWNYIVYKRKRVHEVIVSVQEEYGKIVRIGPNDVLISDPETIWRINSARSVYGRGEWYGSTRINPYAHSLFSEMDTAKHDKRKAQLSFGFSGKGLTDLEGKVNMQLFVLIDVLKEKVRQGGGQFVVDISRLLQYFQVDLITHAAIGEAWGDLTSEKDRFNYLDTGDRLFPSIHAAATVPFLRSLFFSPLFLRFFGPSTTKGWLGYYHDAVVKKVASPQVEEDGDNTLSVWLKHGVTPAEAEVDLALLMPAGTETSISTIRGVFMYLMTCPRIYSKLKEEIAKGIEEGRISSPISSEEARNLPYLQAVVNEGMRMAPPLTTGFAKKVPVGGDIVCGKELPADTEIYINFISMMKNQEIFGQDVGVFRPERFIDCDEATKAKRLKLVDLNFGYGRWLCLGKSLAWMEMNKIFVELLTIGN
ncbi:hypothetical protein TruAng_004025 [Truncatella angustata]|nr:hypothetical protein TruAng_004025 [Truncatella angustata]